MGEIYKGYSYVDFSYLLREFKNENNEVEKSETLKLKEKNVEKKAIEKKKQPQVCNNEINNTKKRTSLMCNSKNLYAYSIEEKVLHDKSCECVKKIPDKDFAMLSEYTDEMKWCSACYRKAMIRRGIADDRKNIDEYVAFFKRVNVSNKDLHTFIIIVFLSIHLKDA